jgi:hypothetical protein
MQNISVSRRANLLYTHLDDSTFTVIIRELSEEERANYDILKNHLLKRFDMLKDPGQKRLTFRQARREGSQKLKNFYTSLLGLATKAFPGESGSTVDKMILDQFILGCDDDKVRLHLIKKQPASSREALSLALTYRAALKYNETLKDNSIVIAGVGRPTARMQSYNYDRQKYQMESMERE